MKISELKELTPDELRAKEPSSGTSCSSSASRNRWASWRTP